jgi:glycosyltransferase involved in cell wall biosynthesis
LRVFLAATSFLPSYGGPAFSVSRLGLALADAGVSVGLWAPDGSAVTSDIMPTAQPLATCLNGSAEEALAHFGLPDVVHDNGVWLPHNHRLARLTCERRIPRVVSARGMLEPWAMLHKRAKKRIAWRLYQRRDLIAAALLHATADAEAAHIEELGLGVPISVIANGVDLPASNELANQVEGKENSHVALFLSRIHPKKGLPMLIEAWKRVQPEGWTLHIAGPDEGGHLAEVQKLIAAACLDHVIRFLGPINGRNRLVAYSSADLFILPTYSENFGIVVAEALAHEVPVITTKATPWLRLEEKHCGWLVEASPDGITDGLKRATSCHSITLKEMGRNGRAMVAENYAWKPIAERFIAAYQSVISKKSA